MKRGKERKREKKRKDRTRISYVKERQIKRMREKWGKAKPTKLKVYMSVLVVRLCLGAIKRERQRGKESDIAQVMYRYFRWGGKKKERLDDPSMFSCNNTGKKTWTSTYRKKTIVFGMKHWPREKNNLHCLCYCWSIQSSSDSLFVLLFVSLCLCLFTSRRRFCTHEYTSQCIEN